MIRYLTESGSVYLVDEERKQARRVVAGAAKVGHTLSDGNWHEYEAVDTNYDNGRLLFTWPPGAPRAYTITTRVVKRGKEYTQ